MPYVSTKNQSFDKLRCVQGTNLQRSSLPPALFPEMANFSFWKLLSGRINVNPKKLSWSRSIFRVSLLCTSTQSWSCANTRFSRKSTFVYVTNPNFRSCVVNTPMRMVLLGSHTNRLFSMVLHSRNRCSASKPRFLSTIILTVLCCNMPYELRTLCMWSRNNWKVFSGSFVCKTSAPRTYVYTQIKSIE